jgi:subtilisin-like proprotein convertase family protein
MRNQLLYAVILSIFAHSPLAAQQILSITPSDQAPFNDVQALIKNHFTGSGVEILDVSSSSDLRSFGFFTDGDSAIGLSRGLVLSTGFSSSIQEVGSFQASYNNLNGDTLAELEPLAVGPLNDVAYFRITFRPYSDSVQFRYVFASEEYPEYACTTFNDIFGLFISGPNPAGGNYVDQNIALIPGTNLAVSINNLHPLNLASIGCPPQNEHFYHDNLGSNQQPVFDGFTDVFVAEAIVVPCATYEMVIAIADVGDGSFDSGVMLEAKSLESLVEISSTLGSSGAVIPETFVADTLEFDFSAVPTNLFPLEIHIGGTATNGIDYQAVESITVVNTPGQTIQILIQPIQDTLQEQLETVVFQVVGIGSNDCFTQTFELYIADPDSLYSSGDSVVFLNNGTIQLSIAPTGISNKSWTFSNNLSKSIDPVFSMVTSEISVATPFDILNDLSILESVCFNLQHDSNEDLDIYLIAPNNTILELSTDNGANGSNYTNTCFSPSAAESIRGGLPLAPASASPFTGTFQPEGLWSDIQGTPVNGTWKLGVIDDQQGLVGSLLNWSMTFSGNDLGNFQYLWSTGATTAEIEVNTPGMYSVTISNQLGAFSKTFTVKEGSVGIKTPGNAAHAFHLFPNPSLGETFLILDKQLVVNALKVYDLNGSLLLEQSNVGLIQNTSRLPKGVYLVSLETNEGVFVQKLLHW